MLARAYVAFLLTLLTVALLPTLLTWSGFVVRSGSMEPTIAVGDVVVAQPFDAASEVPLGRVVVFPNPAKPESDELLLHRVVENLGGGEFATAGDANATYDASPVTSSDLDAQARLLVPLIGRPVVWLADGRLLTGGAWLLATAAALVLARRRRDEHVDGDHPGGGRRPVRSGRALIRRVRRGGSLAGGLAIVTATGMAISGTHTATAAFTSRSITGSNTWSVAEAPRQPYTDQVLVDTPYAYYQVDEASGSLAADSSGNARPGTFAAVSAYRQTNGLPDNAGFAVKLGGAGRLVTGGPAISDPTTFSLELWFKTTTKNGGKLIGFESTRNASSLSADRHVFMRTDGRLEYGGWIESGPYSTITSPQAYNNGGWHHLVVTASPRGNRQDAVIYVDGLAVASGKTTRTGEYAGWWRVGSGGVPLLSGYPSAAFDGSIDQVAVYESELSAARVESHWAAR
ncbi:LamG domain-containing protein [Nocardioides salsibiostraticola]